MTSPDPTAHSETPGEQTVPGPQAASDPQDSPGGRVGVAVHAALAAEIIFPAIGIALAGTIFGVAAPDTIAWMILVPAAIVLIARTRPWRQSLGVRGLGIAVITGVLLAAYGSSMFTAINHLQVGTAVALSMTVQLLIGVIHGQEKRRFLSLALALAGYVPFGYQAFPGTVDGAAMQSSMMASLFAGAVLIGMMMMRGVACLIFVGPTMMRRIVAQRAGARTEARYNVFFPAVAMVAGVVLLGQVPTLLDLLGLALITGALWIMSGVTIVPRRFFRKRGSGEMTTD